MTSLWSRTKSRIEGFNRRTTAELEREDRDGDHGQPSRPAETWRAFALRLPVVFVFYVAFFGFFSTAVDGITPTFTNVVQNGLGFGILMVVFEVAWKGWRFRRGRGPGPD